MTVDSSGNHHAPKGTPGGGRFMRQFRQGSDVVLTETVPADEFHQVTFNTVQLGDEVVDGSTSSGFVVRKDITDGVRRLILHNGARVRFDADADGFEVRRRTEPLPYDLDSHDYWANVAAARDPRQSVEVLQEIVDAEAEDDFMLAIAEHPKATSEMLDKASRHNSLQVREAALNRDELWMETLFRLQREARERAEQEQTLLRAEGISPNARHREQAITALQSQADRAESIIWRRLA
jgi:hypothetical protein